jgi:hypothetical protein
MHTPKVIRRTTQKVGVGSVGRKREKAMQRDGLILKFKDKDAFGHFCVRLAEERIPFSLIGFQTVVLIGITQASDIPERLRGLFSTFQDMGHFDILLRAAKGRRKLPSQAEAEKIIEDLIKNF